MRPIKAWIVCAKKEGGLVPMIFNTGTKTIYETKEEAVKDWDGWGFMADLIEVEIRPVIRRKKK